MVKYSIFIPFYNEENILEANVLRVHQQLKKHADFEIHLIDDGSTDGSSLIACELSKNYREIKITTCENGPSRRENLFAQFRNSKSDIIAFTDIDLAVPEKYFDALFEAVEQGNDVCIASRYDPGSKIKREWWRRVISFCYTNSLQLLFNSKISDFQCGFKAFKRETMTNVLEKLGYDHSFKRGWFLDAEFLIRADREGKKIKMLPVEWNCGKRSTFRIIRELRMIPYVIGLWWRLR